MAEVLPISDFFFSGNFVFKMIEKRSQNPSGKACVRISLENIDSSHKEIRDSYSFQGIWKGGNPVGLCPDAWIKVCARFLNLNAFQICTISPQGMTIRSYARSPFKSYLQPSTRIPTAILCLIITWPYFWCSATSLHLQRMAVSHSHMLTINIFAGTYF